MIKNLIITLVAAFAFGAAQADAPKTTVDVKRDLIHQMAQDKFIPSEAIEAAAIAKYVDSDKAPVLLQTGGPSLWEKYASWMNLIKVLGVILVLIAFNGIIRNIIKGIWHLIVAVPVEVYQVGMLSVTILGTIAPHLLWTSPHAFYLALLCSFTNLMLIGWILTTHPVLANAIAKLFNLGIPIGCVVSFWAMLYFGGLSYFYQSEIFGFFAVVGFSGVLSFGMTYRPGVLYLDFNEKMLPAVVFGHALLIGGYVLASMNGALPAWFSLFKSGIEYYATIALGVGLLVGSSPFFEKNAVGLYVMLMVVTFALATAGFTMYDFKVISSIIMIFFTLFMLEWIGYLSFKANWIIGCLFTGGFLYLSATVLQSISLKFV